MEPEGSLPHSQVPATYPCLSQINSFHAPNPTSWRSFFILSSHLRLDHPSALFPSGFPTKRLFSPIYATCTAHLFLLNLINGRILIKEYIPLSSSLCSFLHFPVSVSLLGPKYSPQLMSKDKKKMGGGRTERTKAVCEQLLKVSRLILK